ncbi:unnamed protein product [Thlaspi arvense]|uniref:Uncharacterized protein n=1 Tax=Thlaspi arvense TaxID=13288 RepID=A0AAU9RPA9_THLAR|nr:unnamed protein product [Thlaspi arvense]
MPVTRVKKEVPNKCSKCLQPGHNRTSCMKQSLFSNLTDHGNAEHTPVVQNVANCLVLGSWLLPMRLIT